MLTGSEEGGIRGDVGKGVEDRQAQCGVQSVKQIRIQTDKIERGRHHKKLTIAKAF